MNQSQYNESQNCCKELQGNKYLNISTEMQINYVQPLFGYVGPFFFFTAIVLNFIIVMVLSRPHMKSPTNIVLMAMALCNMMTALSPTPWIIYMFTFGNYYKPLGPVQACQAWTFMNEDIPIIFHTASIWLTVLLSVQTFFYICRASLAKKWCTRSKSINISVLVIFMAFLHELPMFFKKDFVPLVIVWRGQSVEVCEIAYPSWINYDVFFGTYYVFRVLFVHLIPSIVLIIFAVLLIKALNITKMKIFANDKKSEWWTLKKRITFMVFVMIFLFILVEIPIAIVTSLHIVSATLVEFLNYDFVNKLLKTLDFLLVVTFSANFFIYYFLSKPFRETFRNIFFCNSNKEFIENSSCDSDNEFFVTRIDVFK